MIRTIPAALAAAALLVAGCGSDGGHAGHGDDGSVDRAFVAAMIPHHESAVQMAEIARRRGESPFVRRLAKDIVGTQQAEIATMREQDRELAEAGEKAGSLGVAHHEMGMDDDPAMLEDADPFDRAFLEVMIPHHEGAVTMAKAELAKGADPELKQLSRAIITAQEREIRAMRAAVKG